MNPSSPSVRLLPLLCAAVLMPAVAQAWPVASTACIGIPWGASRAEVQKILEARGMKPPALPEEKEGEGKKKSPSSFSLSGGDMAGNPVKTWTFHFSSDGTFAGASIEMPTESPKTMLPKLKAQLVEKYGAAQKSDATSAEWVVAARMGERGPKRISFELSGDGNGNHSKGSNGDQRRGWGWGRGRDNQRERERDRDQDKLSSPGTVTLKYEDLAAKGGSGSAGPLGTSSL